MARGPRLLPALALAVLAASPSHAQEAGDIDGIRVEGNQRIEDSTVLSNLRVTGERQLRPGDPFDPVLLDAALKALFETELFADVTLIRDGNTLVVRVTENPIVNQVAFEGNQRVEDGDLANEVSLRPRIVFTRSKVRSDARRILAIYQRSGRFAAAVVPKVVLLDQNRVDVVFEIEEGPLTGVERINIVGNRAFSDGSLREVMRTRESRWWRFLSSSDRYDPDQFEFDQEMLRRHYQDNGYPQFEIESATAELRPERDAFLITIAVDEGLRFTFGAVEVDSEVGEVDVEEIRDIIQIDPGDEYDRNAVTEAVEDLGSAAVTTGQPFVQVRAEQVPDEEAGEMDVTFHIERGPRVYVDRIDIVGNVRTVDRVIRRHIRIAEGDPLNPSLLARSRTLIGNLGFFGGVEFEEMPGDAPDRRNLRVAVSERSTGEISFGAGYSSTRGAVGNLSLRERNLLGEGKSLTASAEASETGHDYSLSYTEPFFLGRDVSFSMSVYNDDVDSSAFSSSALRTRSTGLGIGFGFSLGEYLRHSLSYGISQRSLRLSNNNDLRPFLHDPGLQANPEKKDVLSSVTATWTLDKRDSALFPSEGYYLRLSARGAGLGGDRRYGRLTSDGGYFRPLFRESWTLGLLYEVGYIEGLGEDISYFDHFQLGGNSFRGFEPAGLGPRLLRGGEASVAIGGKAFGVATAEAKVDLGLPKELGMHGRLFLIAGFVGLVDDVDEEAIRANNHEYRNDTSMRASAGVGLSWNSPAGPIRIDLTTPLAKEEYDLTEGFTFSVGTTF